MHPINRVLDRFGLQLRRMQPQLTTAEDRTLFERISREYNVIWTERSIVRLQDGFTGHYPVNFGRDKNFVLMGFATRFHPTGKILDVASSLEWVAGAAAAGADITYLDIRDHRMRDHMPFPYVVADAIDMPFGNGEFDTVTFWQLLHHVGCLHGQDIDFDKPRRVVEEITRVLKPGGRSLCVTLVKSGAGVLPYGYSRIFGLQEIEDIFAGSGLEITKRTLRDGRTYEEIQTPISVVDPATDFTNWIGDFGMYELRKT